MTQQQFEALVAVQDNGCWFRGIGLSRPRVYHHGRGQAGARVAWQLWKGEIPNGLAVCHRCDEPRCVNPDHLFLGTHADNMEDRGVKVRSRPWGIAYLLTNIEPTLWRATKERAAREGRPLRWVILQFLKLYVEKGLQ